MTPVIVVNFATAEINEGGSKFGTNEKMYLAKDSEDVRDTM